LFPFDFSDDFFIDSSFVNHSDSSLLQTDDDWTTLVNNFKLSKGKNNFTIGHLNINSIQNKFHHTSSLLDIANCDILSINESKLDSSMPDTLFSHPNYKLVRRDRNLNCGGGILVYIKKAIVVSAIDIGHPFEIVSFKLKCNKKIQNFICTYKSPSVRNIDYIDYLDTFIDKIDPHSNIFIIGDLNMNWSDSKGCQLRSFCDNKNFRNFVCMPTRSKLTLRSNTSTAIDVILHNHSAIKHTESIKFPFSDHNIVLAECNFVSNTVKHNIVHCRKLTLETLDKIKADVILCDFSSLNYITNVNSRWSAFKSVLLCLLNKHAPLKKSNSKCIDNVPWFDSDLFRKQKNCIKLFSIYNKSASESSLL